jgi:hypothetical protein
MKKETIIQTLKDNYSRDLRKQVVKTLLANEKESNTPNYKIVNQIFSYVLRELDWKMAENTEKWDNTPLNIMEEVFPKITTTKWFQEQLLTVEKMIEMEIKS